jgi:hypothetical protein
MNHKLQQDTLFLRSKARRILVILERQQAILELGRHSLFFDTQHKVPTRHFIPTQ